jgi:hypothetical protein
MAACSSEPERRDVTDMVYGALLMYRARCKEVGGAMRILCGARRRAAPPPPAPRGAAARRRGASSGGVRRRHRRCRRPDLLCIEQRRTTTSRLRELYLLHSSTV